MINLLRKAAAFVRRDFLIESSYKMSFAMKVLDSMIVLVFFYFFSRMVDQTGERSESYGGDYLSFVVVGLAFARYFQLTLKMFSASIRDAQVTGSLEAMLSSQTDSLVLVLMSSLYGLISGAIQLILILFAGAIFMGVDFSDMNLFATVLVFVLSVMSFVAFGVFSAATILWLKKGDPFTWFMGGMATMVGGAYFPIDVLPAWLQKVSLVIPITYSLDALRLTLLKGHSVDMVAGPLMILGLMAGVLLPLSLVLFGVMVRKGRKEGTLMQY